MRTEVYSRVSFSCSVFKKSNIAYLSRRGWPHNQIDSTALERHFAVKPQLEAFTRAPTTRAAARLLAGRDAAGKGVPGESTGVEADGALGRFRDGRETNSCSSVVGAVEDLGL